MIADECGHDSSAPPRGCPDAPIPRCVVTDWAARIGQHLTPEGAVSVPPRIAAWLVAKAGVTGDKRILLRGTDPEAYEVLAALHIAALHHRSVVGTESGIDKRNSRDLATWLTTGDAAHQLRVTDRAIRKWIAAKRLPATKVGGRWLLNCNDIRIAQALAWPTEEGNDGDQRIRGSDCASRLDPTPT